MGMKKRSSPQCRSCSCQKTFRSKVILWYYRTNYCCKFFSFLVLLIEPKRNDIPSILYSYWTRIGNDDLYEHRECISASICDSIERVVFSSHEIDKQMFCDKNTTNILRKSNVYRYTLVFSAACKFIFVRVFFSLLTHVH